MGKIHFSVRATTASSSNVILILLLTNIIFIFGKDRYPDPLNPIAVSGFYECHSDSLDDH